MIVIIILAVRLANGWCNQNTGASNVYVVTDTGPGSSGAMAADSTSLAELQSTGIQAVKEKHVTFKADDVNKTDFKEVGEAGAWELDTAWLNESITDDNDIKKMVDHTLRDGVAVKEENIVQDLSDTVKQSFMGPKAKDIRSSAVKARELVPEISSRKIDGNVDFNSLHLYKDRAPPTQVSSNANDVAQWGVTESYLHHKITNAQF